MENFQLTAFLEINGIGSASGLVYQDRSLFIISDNSGFLYEYKIDTAVLQHHRLIENSSENILKKNKPDFEAMALKGNELHIFGSGSTEKRNRQFIFNTETHTASEENLTSLYQKIKQTAGISDDELNIEGALFHRDHLYLFQRGNGMNSKNGIIKITNKCHTEQACTELSRSIEVEFQIVTLPKIKHVEATFTDAIAVEDKIYFLAAAEDTLSTYEDGEILGSLMGCLDMETFKIDFTHEISNQHKFEGVTLYKNSEDTMEFLLCEDNDTEALESKIYLLTLSK